jgi:hypothetical protein
VVDIEGGRVWCGRYMRVTVYQDRLVLSSVPKRKLVGVGASRRSQKLVPEANAKDGLGSHLSRVLGLMGC